MKKVLPMYIDSTGDWALKGLGPLPGFTFEPWFCRMDINHYFDIPSYVHESELVISDKPLGKDAYKVMLDMKDWVVHFLDVETDPDCHEHIAKQTGIVLSRLGLSDKELYIRIDY